MSPIANPVFTDRRAKIVTRSFGFSTASLSLAVQSFCLSNRLGRIALHQRQLMLPPNAHGKADHLIRSP
jgi:hypothetical protein